MLFLDLSKRNQIFMQKEMEKLITNMASGIEGLYLIRDTGPKKVWKIFGIGKQAISGYWKLRNMFY